MEMDCERRNRLGLVPCPRVQWQRALDIGRVSTERFGRIREILTIKSAKYFRVCGDTHPHRLLTVFDVANAVEIDTP